MVINSNPDEYIVPANVSIAEIKVKGSKFIATIVPVKTKEEAEARYFDLKKQYYNATHNCFAYRLDNSEYRFSDDGEPSGTAGKPIFLVLDGKKLNQALCVVTRFYGGTKLGTGGLIRAYSDAARQALSGLKIKTMVHTQQLDLDFKYDQENTIRNTLAEVSGKIVDSNYSDKIQMKVAIPLSRVENFSEMLTEKSNSTIQIKRI